MKIFFTEEEVARILASALENGPRIKANEIVSEIHWEVQNKKPQLHGVWIVVAENCGKEVKKP